ncbi:MAG: class I SAM-dependent methyltransferase [Candidatus Hodarchaeota archaeon]
MNQERKNKPEFDFQAVFEPDDYLHFYGLALTNKRTKKETEFLVRELKLNNDMKILDLACGHGRHTNQLAALGYSVIGVDINQDFLEIAKKKSKSKGLNVKFIKNDMRKIKFKEEFDRVLLLFTSFGYFEDNENLLVLQNVFNALKPEGLFCFDTFNRDTFLEHFLPYNVVEIGNDLMIDRNTFNSITGRFYNRRIVIRNGKRKDKPYFIRLYNLTELKDLLYRVGFVIYKIFSNWDAKPFTSFSKRMIIISKKGNKRK